MRHPAHLFAMLAMLAVAACDSRSAECNCDSSLDCQSDQVCVDCICRKTCFDDYDCGATERCERGACVANGGASDGARGGDGAGAGGDDVSGGDGFSSGDPPVGCECAAGEIWWGGACGTDGTERRTCSNGCDWDALECYETCVVNETPEVTCNDTEDNDCDGLFNCADPDCVDQPCGDPGTTACSEPDSCDDTGACNPRDLAEGEEGTCPTCWDCDGEGTCVVVTDGEQDAGCDGGVTGCSGADECSGGECDFNHLEDGSEGDCGTCKDCYGGVCDDVPNGDQDVGCNAAASSNGCSGADSCQGGSCDFNHNDSGTEGNCDTCKDCNGNGGCGNVTYNHQDIGCNGTCDRCQNGSCNNNEVTCYQDQDGDGYSSGATTTMCAPCGGNYPLTSDTARDCNDSKGDMNPGAGYSTTARDCNGDWDCDCVAGIQRSPSQVYTSCDCSGTCPGGSCTGTTSTTCGTSGTTACDGCGCGSCNTGGSATIGCK